MSTISSSKRPLPPGWVVRESKSHTGRKYFFHTHSGASSWKHPLDLSPKEEIPKSRKELKRHHNYETGSTTSSTLEYIAKRRFTSPLTSPDQQSHHSTKTSTSKTNNSNVSKKSYQPPTHKTKSSKSASALTSGKLLKHSALTTKESKEDLNKKLEKLENTKTSKPKSPVKFACSKTKASHIAYWVSKVNNSFEPREHGSAAGESDAAKVPLDFDAVSVKDLNGDSLLDSSRAESGQQTRDCTTKGSQNSESNKPGAGTSRRNSEPCISPPTHRERVRTFSSSSKGASISPTTPPLGFTPFGQLAGTSTVNSQPKPCVPMNIDVQVPASQVNTTDTTAVNNTVELSGNPPPVQSPVSQAQLINVFPGQAMFSDSGGNAFGFPRVVQSSGIQPGMEGRPLISPVFPSIFVPVQNAELNVNDGPTMNNAFEGQAAHDSGYDDMIDMEVDNCEELHASIMAELQEVRSSFVVNPGQMSQDQPQSRPNHSYGDGLYIILDTNILLSHLKFVTELKDFPIEGVGRPTLIVPWIVMQELDSLKSDSWKIKRGKIVTDETKDRQKGVDIQARQAVRFLHSCFEAQHPRIRGQTLTEVNEHVSNIPEESNDDRILHCCLLFQMKASNGNAVLFSNDQNLCSKAMINGVRAFQSHNLIDGMRDLFQNKELVLRADYFTDYYDQLKVQEKLADKRAKADDIICELQCVMREGLAVIVETEMRAAYDDLWDTIVCLKPPWTLRDLLQIIDKHWIAVFGDVVKRSMQTTVKELKNQLNPEKGVQGCLANAAKLLETAHTLFEAFAKRSSYNGAVTKCIAAIVVLQKKCKDCKEESPTPTATKPVPNPIVIMPAPSLNYRALPSPSLQSVTTVHGSTAQTDEITPPSSDETASVVSGSIQGEINTATVLQPYEEVLSAFDVIWNAVNQFSAQIFSALSYPHSIPMSIIESLPKPTKGEAVNFLSRLCPCLGSLVSALQHVLRLPVEQLSSEPQSFDNLLDTIARFLREILSLECKVTSQALCQFCQNPNSRTALIQGLSQLDRALAMLQHCSSCVAQVKDV